MPGAVALGMPGGMSERAEASTSELLSRAGFAHAFFARRGGVSPAPWSSLNFAASSGDDLERVAENLRRAAALLGIASDRLYFLSQVHGVDHVLLDGSEAQGEVLRREGDVTLAVVPGVGCGVRSADCAPVLVGDRASGAVVAIHSGWRGTTLNVAGAGIAALRDRVGGSGDLVAAIGPHIEACCFEVGDDVASELASCSTAGARAVERRDGKAHVNLRAIIHAQLEAAGLASDDIDDVRGCTVCEPERFHSYRRDGKVSGRLLSAIVSRDRAPRASG